jgi:hypothetical protein
MQGLKKTYYNRDNKVRLGCVQRMEKIYVRVKKPTITETIRLG